MTGFADHDDSLGAVGQFTDRAPREIELFDFTMFSPGMRGGFVRLRHPRRVENPSAGAAPTAALWC
jgi:hypothetical protein